jgi:hypothetical protein
MCTFAHAQFFANQAFDLNVVHQLAFTENGAGLSLADIKGDGWDDITFCNTNAFPSIYLNNGDAFISFELPFNFDEEVKQCNWVDYDNDGLRDLVFTSLRGPMRVYHNEGDLNFTDATFSTGLTFDGFETYGNSWCDYDRDGDLDVYISNYYGADYGEVESENFLYANNGDGTFSDVTSIAGVGDGENYTFLGIWMNVNDDLWPDLFISNDRFESENSLYLNNGDGTFSDISESAQIDYAILSMGVAADDFDNDGDDDLYVANWNDNLMLRNDNGVFVNIAPNNGTDINRFSWGTNFLDADNDGWKDLYVATAPHFTGPGQDQLLRNDSSAFTNVTIQCGFGADSEVSYGTAVADLNHDGAVDIVTLDLAPSFSSVWMNTPTNANWIQTALHGTTSNRDGVGAKLICYTHNMTQTNVVRCGESYLSQNSFVEHFGLGQFDFADSLKVLWPSGVVDTWYQVVANQIVHLHEGQGFRSLIASSYPTTICQNDSVALYLVNEGLTLMEWSNGTLENTLVTDQLGLYSAHVMDPYGNVFVTNSIEIDSWPLIEFEATLNPPHCAGESGLVTFNSDQNLLALWLNGESVQIDTDYSIETGEYTAIWMDVNGCVQELNMEVVAPSELQLEMVIEPISCAGSSDGSILSQVTGGTAPYTWVSGTNNWNGLMPGDYELAVIDAQGCEADQWIEISEPSPIEIEVDWTDPTCNGLNDGHVNYAIAGGVGDLEVVTTWDNNNVVQAGWHSVLVTDEMGCTAIHEFELIAPLPLSLNLELISALDNSATGSAWANVEGGTPPFNYWWSNGNGNTNEAMNLPPNEYALQVFDSEGCFTDTTFIIQSIVLIHESDAGHVLLYPNPGSDLIHFPDQSEFVSLLDEKGCRMAYEPMNSRTLNVQSLPAGNYILTLLLPSGEVRAVHWTKLGR